MQYTHAYELCCFTSIIIIIILPINPGLSHGINTSGPAPLCQGTLLCSVQSSCSCAPVCACTDIRALGNMMMTSGRLPVMLLQVAHWKVHKKQCKQLQQEKEAAAAKSAAKR
jgi:hypothetical protein